MNQKNVSKVKPNFGVKGWIVLIYMFLVFFLNTTCDSGWQNVLNYFQETFGWNATTLMTYVSVGKAITIVTAYLFGRLLWESGPQKMCAVPGGQIRHRERTKFIDPHCGVMVLCRPLDFTPLVLPGGIGINDRIFFDFFTLLCIEKTACIFSKRLYSRDFIIFPMPGK